MSLKQKEVAKLKAMKRTGKKTASLAATNTPRFIQLADGSPRLKVSLNGQVRLLKLSTTAEAVAQRLRSQPIMEEEEEEGILASLGKIVKFRKEEFTYLQELWDSKSTTVFKPKSRGMSP